MCGIAGIVASDGLRPGEAARLPRMRDVIAHRGPDDAGIWFDERAALGHRRLSIVDLATGSQPLGNEDGTIQIVFNGEIYNHADLRPELEAAGHRYHTRCDTEAIVHAYEQWGDDCVHRFRGMFAFALWDAPKRRLLLARDRLGIKPLYWTRPRRPADLRVGDQGDSRQRPGRAAGERGPGCRSCSGRATCPAKRRSSRASRSCCPGTYWSTNRVASTTRQYLGRSRRCCAGSAGARRPRVGRPLPCAARGVGAPAADVGRAARDVPVRRSRQQRHRRNHGAHDRSAAPDLLGRVQGAGVQRADLGARGRAGHRRRRARGRHRRRRVLRRAAAPRMARGRTDRASLERAALLRLGARPRARDRRADRRRQRRTARRVRQVSPRPHELARRRRVRPRDARCGAALDRRASDPGAARPRRAVRPPLVSRRRALTPEAAFFDNFAAVPLARQRELFDGRLRAARHARTGLQRITCLARSPRRAAAARSAALRRHQDVSRRAADEAGPDEHGGLDRKPRAVSRSQARGVRRHHARGMEALRLHDQARAS